MSDQSKHSTTTETLPSGSTICKNGGTKVSPKSPGNGASSNRSNSAPRSDISNSVPASASLKTTMGFAAVGARQIRTFEPIPLSDVPNETSHSVLLAVFQFFNVDNPSNHDAIFLLCARDFGLKTAEWLAAKFHWQCQRPLQALSAMLNGPGRNCNARSAKRKLLSGSPVSSKKRSSAE